MPAFIYEITVMGSRGKDPELRYFANGTASLHISIATREQWTDKVTGAVQEVTQWHTASLIGNQAEIVAKYMKKGDKIWIRGPLQTKIYGCGAFPDPTASPRASILKWKCSRVVRMGSEILRITACECWLNAVGMVK